MNLSSLQQQLGLEGDNQYPPVEKWHPQLSGDMDMVIRRDGTWWHEGVQIKREKLVRLFASILRKEGDEYFLLTPVEKWRIRVEDRPLLIVMIERINNDIRAVTNAGDMLSIGKKHPLLMSELDGVLLPEVLVRADLYARFSRNAFYDLTEMANEDSNGRYFVISGENKYCLS
ncbi:MAG: DUF1285 domain-containing protein [Saccharospirillaceae bacterium]|nr:DUF1285 domain-containing protein [Saccharospirillaceae bacterium]MCD8531705.1 DUF1285 domain-containing protein [Saccharospirillaceae bacterium]